MKWKSKQVKQYEEAKEYVDTIILPLVPFEFLGEDAAKTALQNEIMTIFVREIEQNLTGRVFQFPQYYYLKDKDLSQEVDRLNKWIQTNQNEWIEHVILLTFDSQWKQFEKDLKGTLLWVPAMYSGDLESEEVTNIMNDQIKELIKLIQSYW